VIAIGAAPAPSRDAIASALRAFGERARAEVRPHDLGARDPDFIERVMPVMDVLYDRYFRCETELDCDVPDEPVLAVANHNGMSGTPDMFCVMTAYWRRYGHVRPSYGLMHDFPFRMPFAGAWLNGCGAIAARRDNAYAALARGAQVLVYPGGDIDACKPFRDRYKIQFAGRRGFLRVAIRAGVRILPIVSVGGHESLYLFTDGRAIAQRLGLPRWLRTNVFPIGFALPYGIIFGNPIPHLPPPVKVHTRFLAPIDLGIPAALADDEDALTEAYARVTGTMQRALDEMAAEGRHGLFPRARPTLASREASPPPSPPATAAWAGELGTRN
jgi:1-acyl-sn-glycerol-3-phosphate acyltransferase